MLGAIDHMGHALAVNTYYSNNSYYPKLVVDRTSQADEKRTDAQIHTVKPSDNNFQTEERATTKTVVEDNKWVVEKYDQNGKLIRLTPPGYVPFGRMVHSILV